MPGADVIGFELELTGALVGALCHKDGMAGLEHLNELIVIAGRVAHIILIGAGAESAQHVMGILGAVCGDGSMKNDVDGLLNSELCAFNEIGKIGFEEG